MKPSIPDVLPLFVPYYRRNLAWGALHVVLDDGNVADDHVRWCMKYASEAGDEEAVTLAGILLSMSKTQRLKLPRAVEKAMRADEVTDER